MSFKRVLIIGIAIFILVQILSLMILDIVKVNEREVALITRFGKIVDQKGPGWHFKIPWIDQVNAVYDTGVQSISTNTSSATKDQQTVNIKVNVQYRLDASKAEDIYRLVKNQDYLNDAIIPPFIQESVKASSSKYTAAELLEKRDVVKTDIENALQNRLKEYYSNVVAVNLENIDWSDQFDKAIEAKVIAEQEALRKKQELEQAKIQAEIDITKAQAQAKATEIQGEALKKNPQVLEQQKIEKWDGKLPQVQGNGSTIIDLSR